MIPNRVLAKGVRAGAPHCPMALFGRPGHHLRFADHVAASEFNGDTGVSPVDHGRDGHATSARAGGRGRAVSEWKPRPGSPDNLYLPIGRLFHTHPPIKIERNRGWRNGDWLRPRCLSPFRRLARQPLPAHR